MSFLHPALLFGLVLAAIPVVLHLLLRAKPKRLPFPALRLLMQRRIENSRRLRLRQLWLLLLRMGLIAIVVLALARPSLPPANYGLTGWEIATLAAIGAFGLAAYFAIMIWWERLPWPRHVMLTRRTMLRGGLGALTALLAFVFCALPYGRRIAAEITTPAPQALANIPVAAVFLCDTSPSMQYQFEGRSRLDAARAIASSHLGRLPPGSKAAVLDLATDTPAVFTPDLAAVQNRLDSLSVQSLAPALNDRLRAALRFQEDDRRRTLSEQGSVAEDRRQDRFVREVYVLTDLARSAWRNDITGSLREELVAAPWLGVYLIDVGVEQPVNAGVIDVKLSQPAVPAGGQVQVSATLRSVGTLKPETTVELWVQGEDGQLLKRDQQTVSLPAAGTAESVFNLDVSASRYLQGEVRLVTSDPMSFDNVGYLTVRVLPPLEVLVAAERANQAEYWLEALRSLKLVNAAYHPTYQPAAALADLPLSKFELVCLINVAQPAPAVWDKLGQFVADGGGVAVFLGDRSALASSNRMGIDPVAYNSPAAQAWLPAELKAQLSFIPARQLDFRESSHPLTQRLERLGVLSALSEIDFHRYWRVAPQEGTLTLARWNDDGSQPALMLRASGRGRALLMATSVDSIAWNELPGNWAFLVLADQMLQLLSRQAAAVHTLRVGDLATLPLADSAPDNSALLRLPDFTQRRVEFPANARDLELPTLTLPGQYQVIPVGNATGWLSAFSVNPLSNESDLTRLDAQQLDDLLGAKRYGLARDIDQLSRTVHTGRLGQEVYGWLMALLLGVFAWEQLTATWFYKADEL